MEGLKSFYQRAQKEYQDFKNYFKSLKKMDEIVIEGHPTRTAF
jgi:hypothetical protein